MSVQCYRNSYGEILNQTGKDSPCGTPNSTDPIIPCCAKGDLCLTNGFCSYQKSLVGGSGYYVAGCTASSGLCPTYPNRCTSQFLPDATWNSTSQLWQCCGVDANYDPACEDPTNEHFVAPEPGSLQTFFSVPREGVGATSTTLEQQSSTTGASTVSTTMTAATESAAVSSRTTSATPNETSVSSSSTHQSGLSIATKAGIGIGAALGALGAISLVVYFIFRKRRGRRSQAGEYSKSLSMDSSGMGFAELADQNALPSELASKDVRKPVEMGTRDSVHELEARRERTV